MIVLLWFVMAVASLVILARADSLFMQVSAAFWAVIAVLLIVSVTDNNEPANNRKQSR